MKKKSGKSTVVADVVGDIAGDPAATETVAASSALALPSSVAIRNARELRQEWLPRATAATVSVDGAAVGDVDTAGLQLLLAWRRAILAAGGRFEWVAASAALREAAAGVGLTQELGLPGAA